MGEVLKYAAPGGRRSSGRWPQPGRPRPGPTSWWPARARRWRYPQDPTEKGAQAPQPRPHLRPRRRGGGRFRAVHARGGGGRRPASRSACGGAGPARAARGGEPEDAVRGAGLPVRAPPAAAARRSWLRQERTAAGLLVAAPGPSWTVDWDVEATPEVAAAAVREIVGRGAHSERRGSRMRLPRAEGDWGREPLPRPPA